MYFWGMKKENPLQDLIERFGGDSTVAKMLNVKPRTIQSWRLGDRKPKPHQALALVEMSKGHLKWGDIYKIERSGNGHRSEKSKKRLDTPEG